MRSELTGSPVRSASSASESDAWAIVFFCLIGLIMSLYFATVSLPPDELPVLIAQYNFG